MINDNVFYSQKDNKYYINIEKSCKFCKKPIEHFGIYVKHFQRGWCDTYFSCPNCNKKVKSLGKVNEFTPVVYIDDLPRDSKPIIITPPTLVNTSNLDVWSARQLRPDKVFDKTKHADRADWEDATIGIMPEQIKELKTENEVKNLLLELKQAKREVINNGIKQLR
jgi:hypothetical protein